jgi:hypothetical protein
MLEAGPTSFHSFWNQIRHNCSAFNLHLPIVMENEVTGVIPDNQSAESLVTDKDVCAESKDEPGNGMFTSCKHRVSKIVGRASRIQEIGWTTNAERGVWSYGLAMSQL